MPTESLGRDKAGSELTKHDFATSQALLQISVQVPKLRRWYRSESTIYVQKPGPACEKAVDE